MELDYFRPAADVRQHVGAYHVFRTSSRLDDVFRAEMPHMRFLARGAMCVDQGSKRVRFSAPMIVVSGPMMRASNVSFASDTTILAATMTPQGWQHLFGMPANHMATRMLPLRDMTPRSGAATIEDRLGQIDDGNALVALADRLLRDQATPVVPRFDAAFVELASRWLLSENSPGVDSLFRQAGMSARQLDRLCNTYFGAPPHKLHRKFKALHIANRFAWSGETDWRALVGDRYYDQSHFIRDFKTMIGCTPGRYIKQPDMLIRVMMLRRLAIPHHNQFSLVG